MKKKEKQREALRKANDKIRETRGITLIALVVTIVVLLILAGITIVYVMGDNGVLQKAKDAKDKTNQAVQEELDQLNSINDWLEGNVIATSKKTPIKLEEQTIAVDIKIIVNGLESEKILRTEGEFFADVNNLLKGKTTAKKEEMIERTMKYWVERGEKLPFEPTIEAYYEQMGVSNLEELAINMYGEEEAKKAMQYFGIDSLENLAIAGLLGEADASPYYERNEDENGNRYWKKKNYIIIPQKEMPLVNTNTYQATKNGEYEFKVQVIETGKEILVKVVVDEINTDIGEDYEVIFDVNMLDIGDNMIQPRDTIYGIVLQNVSTKQYTSFEGVAIVINGIAHSIANENIKIIESEDGTKKCNYIDMYDLNEVIWDYARKYKIYKFQYNVIILKDGKIYIKDKTFVWN